MIKLFREVDSSKITEYLKEIKLSSLRGPKRHIEEANIEPNSIVDVKQDL